MASNSRNWVSMPHASIPTPTKWSISMSGQTVDWPRFLSCKRDRGRDECHLLHAVSFFYAMYLTFPQHVHCFIFMYSSPRSLERKESYLESLPILATSNTIYRK